MFGGFDIVCVGLVFNAALIVLHLFSCRFVGFV